MGVAMQYTAPSAVHTLSNFISSAGDRKKAKLNSYTIRHNETKSIDRLFLYIHLYSPYNMVAQATQEKYDK